MSKKKDKRLIPLDLDGIVEDEQKELAEQRAALKALLGGDGAAQ